MDAPPTKAEYEALKSYVDNLRGRQREAARRYYVAHADAINKRRYENLKADEEAWKRSNEYISDYKKRKQQELKDMAAAGDADAERRLEEMREKKREYMRNYYREKKGKKAGAEQASHDGTPSS